MGILEMTYFNFLHGRQRNWIARLINSMRSLSKEVPEPPRTLVSEVPDLPLTEWKEGGHADGFIQLLLFLIYSGSVYVY